MSLLGKILGLSGGKRSSPQADGRSTNAKVASLPGNPRVDKFGGDALAHQWRDRLARGEWEGFGDFLRAEPDPAARDFYLSALSDTLTGWPAWVDEWVERSPQDMLPRLFRGNRYINYAWEARGSGYAKSVKAEMWPLFFGRLDAAEADLNVAADLAPEDPGPWVLMITTARGRQMGIPEVRRRYAEVERRYPFHGAACAAVLQAVAAKWDGSDEMMFEFARGMSARAPVGSSVHALIADAHFEAWGQERPKDYWQRPEVREEILQAARRGLTDPDGKTVKVGTRNRFAFCFWLLGERTLLREQFDLIGDSITSPWTFSANPVLMFNQARQFAMTTTNP